MKKSILSLEGVEVLSKNKQKEMKGGRRRSSCTSATTFFECSQIAGCQWYTGSTSYCYEGVPHIAP
jgi:hypothetical protein